MTAQPATNEDLERLFERMLGAFAKKEDIQQLPTFADVERIVGDVFEMMADRFDLIDQRLDRIEDKLDRTAAIVDIHSVDIRQLKRKLSI